MHSPEEREQLEQVRRELAAKRKAEREARLPDDPPLDQLPNPWLVDSAYLLDELARIRDLANRMPVTQKSLLPGKSVVDAIWNLEEQLRYLLRLHRDGQQSFARRATQDAGSHHVHTTDAPDPVSAPLAEIRA